MIMKKIEVSVVVCTLNEEDNIKECITCVKKNFPSEIIVVDGGSDDKTTGIASKLGVKVIKSPKGLARQRQVGVDKATQPYLAFVDADDRLHPKCLSKLLQESKKYDYWAVQAQTLAYKPKTYWEKAMDYNLRFFINRKGKTNMVGRPALYRKEAFKYVRFNPLFNFGDEDTDLSRQMEKKNLLQGIGSGISYRKHLKTLRECLKQWVKYGEGDARFVYKNPDRLSNMLFHLLINYPTKKSASLIKRGKGKYIAFFILQGWTRFFGMIKEAIVIKISGLSEAS